MWLYRRAFASVIACGLLFGSLFFLRLQLGDRKPAAPEFLPNAARFRPARVCSARGLVLVSSPPAHSHRRQEIRETWAHPSVTQSLDISVAFGVGAANNIDAQRSIDWEAEIYGDMFQDEAAKDGPSRVIQFLKAARSACAPMPEFVMKMDDKVFVNSYYLDELLENLETYSSSNTMWCLEWNRQLDKVGSNATWVVMRSQSNDSAQPAYCLGTMYLMTGRALDAVIRRHESQPGLLQLPEDAYVTGVLAREARVTLSLLGERFVFDPQVEEADPMKVSFAYMGERVESDTRKLWDAFMKEIGINNRRSDIGL